MSSNKTFYQNEALQNQQFQNQQVLQQQAEGYNTQMSDTQYQRSVSDMESAGLNPDAMTPSGSSPSVSPGNASGGSVGDRSFGGLVNSVATLMNASSGMYSAVKQGQVADTQSTKNLSDAFAAYNSSIENSRHNLATEGLTATQIVNQSKQFDDQMKVNMSQFMQNFALANKQYDLKASNSASYLRNQGIATMTDTASKLS